MRLVKLFGISILVFGILILLLSGLFPSNVRISRAINIVAPLQEVRNHLRNLETWQYWNEMTRQKDLTNKIFSDSFFSSDQMRIRLVAESSDLIHTSWNFNENESVNGRFQLVAAADTTIVQWYFDFQLKWYPWEKFGSIIFDKQLGPPMEASLTSLKKFIENN